MSFDLAAPASVRLTVHDVRGRKVATLAEGARGPGRHTIGWGARGENGEPLPGGVYFVRLEAGAETATSKVVLRR